VSAACSCSIKDCCNRPHERFTRLRGPAATKGFAPSDRDPISEVMQHLELSDNETAALIKELTDITGNDRYPFSARIQTLRAILAKLRPEPVREPLPRLRSTRRRELPLPNVVEDEIDEQGSDEPSTAPRCSPRAAC
jgi:hypothetical protein